MKKRIISSLLLAGAVAVAPCAEATTIISHGSDFTAFNAAEVISIDYVGSGVRTIASSPRIITAAIKRNPISSGSQSFTINGLHFGSQSTTCSVSSYDAAGNFLSGNSFTAGPLSGAWSRTITIAATALTGNAHVSAECTIPASANGIVVGVVASP